MTSGRRTTYAPEPCRISTRPIRDRLRSAWLTVAAGPEAQRQFALGGSRAPAPICSLMIRFRICSATESARRAVLTGPIPASTTASGRRCCVMPLTLPERQSDNVAMPLGAGVRVSDPGTRWTVPDPARLATLIRLRAVRMVAPQGFGYLGQALSSAEEVAALFAVARPGMDRMVCSPGHYVIAFYAAAAETGLLPDEALAGYGQDGSALEAIGSERTPVLDYVCGSLLPPRTAPGRATRTRSPAPESVPSRSPPAPTRPARSRPAPRPAAARSRPPPRRTRSRSGRGSRPSGPPPAGPPRTARPPPRPRRAPGPGSRSPAAPPSAPRGAGSAWPAAPGRAPSSGSPDPTRARLPQVA